MTGDPVLHNYLFVGSVLFALGGLGFLTRRNLILMMLSAEMMLHGVSVNLVAFSRHHANLQGQAFTAFVLTVATCEAGLALAIILSLFRRRHTLDVTAWRDLGEAPPEASQLGHSGNVPSDESPEQEFPKLTPAGTVPGVRRQETVARV